MEKDPNVDVTIKRKLMHVIVELDIWRSRWQMADGTNSAYARFRVHAIAAQEHARDALAELHQVNGWPPPQGIFAARKEP